MAPSSKSGRPSHHLIRTWASSGDSRRPRPGDGVTFNQSEAPGAITAKSLDLVVGGEASQRAAWSRSSKTADKEACFGVYSITVEKQTTALLSGTERLNCSQALSTQCSMFAELIQEAHKEAR